jgi:hypothetical protein
VTRVQPGLADLPRELLTPEGGIGNKRSAGSTFHESVERQLERARDFLDPCGSAAPGVQIYLTVKVQLLGAASAFSASSLAPVVTVAV